MKPRPGQHDERTEPRLTAGRAEELDRLYRPPFSVPPEEPPPGATPPPHAESNFLSVAIAAEIRKTHSIWWLTGMRQNDKLKLDGELAFGANSQSIRASSYCR